MSEITEGWSQLCQQLSSSLEQPNPQWLSQQSHGPVSDTLQRSPCLQHQLCLSIQQLRPEFHPQNTTFHSTFFFQIHSGKGRHRAGECCTLCRTQEPEHSSRWRAGTIHMALTTAVARRQGKAEESCGCFCPGKAALLFISIHSLFLKGFSNHAVQPSIRGCKAQVATTQIRKQRLRRASGTQLSLCDEKLFFGPSTSPGCRNGSWHCQKGS